MTGVGIRELKSRLSYYIDSVCRGEEIMVTKRGKVVARLVSEPKKTTRLRDELAALVADGLLALPTGQPTRRPPGSVKTKGRQVSDLVLEDRR